MTSTTATSGLVRGYRNVTRDGGLVLGSLPSRPLMSQEPAVRLVISRVMQGGPPPDGQPPVGPGCQSGGSSNTRAISRVVLA